MPRKPVPDPGQFLDLHFPLAGIDVSQAFDRQLPRPLQNGQYARTTPIGQNVRAYEPSTLRARGGQRPGLAKYMLPSAGGNIQELNAIVGIYPTGAGIYIPGSVNSLPQTKVLHSVTAYPAQTWSIWNRTTQVTTGAIQAGDAAVISDGTNFYLISPPGNGGAFTVSRITAAGATTWTNTYVGANGAVPTIAYDGSTYLWFSIASGTGAGVYKILASNGTGGGPVLSGFSQGEQVAIAGNVLAVTTSNGIVLFNATTLATIAVVNVALSTLPYSTSLFADGTNFYVVIPGVGSNFQIRKISAAGATLWTTPVGNIYSAMYFSGTAQVIVSGNNVNLALDPTSGLAVGVGPGTNITSMYDCGGNYLVAASVFDQIFYFSDGISQMYYVFGVVIGRGIAGITPASVVSTGQVSDAGNTSSMLSNRAISLVAVANGTVKVAYGGQWWSTTNGASALSAQALPIRSTVLNGVMYFLDGTNYKQYTASTNTVAAWTASAGSLPVDSNSGLCRIIATWHGRVWLAGLPLQPQDWFASALNNARDWNYAPTSPAGNQAISSTVGPQGQVLDQVTGLAPYTDDIMIMGGARSIWMFQGDPMYGGQIVLLSNLVGMAYGQAWTLDPYGNMFFYSNPPGVYMMVPGQQPQRISQQIESLLVRVNIDTVVIRLAWDDAMQGLHVFLTPFVASVPATHFFWEMRAGAWWTETFANTNFNPIAIYSYFGNRPSDRVCLLGGADGLVRSFLNQSPNDDGSAIASSVVIGPILSPNLDEMMLKSLQAVLAEVSGSVTYSVYVGQTAEIALDSAPIATGTWNAGRNLTTHVRRSGHAVFIKLSASNPWAMEAIRALVWSQGKVRMRGY